MGGRTTPWPEKSTTGDRQTDTYILSRLRIARHGSITVAGRHQRSINHIEFVRLNS
jgi:hypothetical protein